MDEGKGTVVRAEDRERETFDDPARGDCSWMTLFSGDMTPTNAMSAGIAELVRSGGQLNLHRHLQPEIYFILEGTGILTIDGLERTVTAGAAVFIPGNAEHGIRNETDALLRLFYVFPTDRFSEVEYRFPPYD